VIGQSVSVYEHRMKRRRYVVYTGLWLSKVYLQYESAYFQEKNIEIFIWKQNFEINFQCERGLSTATGRK